MSYIIIINSYGKAESKKNLKTKSQRDQLGDCFAMIKSTYWMSHRQMEREEGAFCDLSEKETKN